MTLNLALNGLGSAVMEGATAEAGLTVMIRIYVEMDRSLTGGTAKDIWERLAGDCRKCVVSQHVIRATMVSSPEGE